MMRLPIIERLLALPTPDRCAAAEVIEQLVAHIAEQSIHVANRIADGKEMGADVWRLALEDVERENSALLVKLANDQPVRVKVAG